MTRMDLFTLGASCLVFFALMEVILVSYLVSRKKGDAARRLDRVSRVVFPGAFLVRILVAFVF